MARYESMTDPKAKKSKGVTLHFQRGKTQTSFKPADVRTGDPAYGKESASKPTPDFVKKAQNAGVDVVHKDGLSYRAGHSTTTKEADTHSTKIHDTPSIPQRAKGKYETMKTQQSTAAIRQKSSPGPKRRLPRVDWLKGKNKKTESGH